MKMNERVRQHFDDHRELVDLSFAVLGKPLEEAIQSLVQAIANDRKLLICGNGGSAGDAQHMAAELVGRLERERPELAAIALTTDSSLLTAVANDYGYNEVFARQVRGLGSAGDVLIALSTSGNSPNVLAAIEAAHQRGMRVVALTGRGGGRVAEVLQQADVHLCVPSDRTMRIQEIHILVIHCLCDGIDSILLGDDDGSTH
jgi:D-sedoheptulose 7-phosphate isomerase